MSDTAIQHHDQFKEQLKEQQQDNALITDGSIITIRSNHSSIADAYSDDADYDSLDTIAEQQQQNEKDVIATSIPTANQQQQRRRRALTITQNNRPGDRDENKPVATNNEITQPGEGQQPTATVTEAFDDMNLQDQIHELDDTLIDGNHHLSDSDYDDDDDDDNLVSGHKRHQSHRSTMSSIHSYVSSASNYDLLLARLGSKDTTSSTSTSTLDTPTQEIRNSFDRVYNDAVCKGEEDEIDWEFWSKVISDFNSVAKSEPKVLSYNIQRGIPPTLRGMIWQLFAKSKNVKLEEQYMQLLKEESVYEKAIARDLPKASFMNHEYFTVQDGQEALFNVVKAYSLYDTEVGYSQGLLHITGPLLLNMPEEEAFCVIVQLMNKYDLRGHFLPQSDLLSQRLYQLEGLVADHLPHIQRHFQAHGVRSNMYAYQWFSTLFAYKFPLDTVFRIYDMIFAEGIETLHRFSVALLERNQSTILSLEFDDLVNFLKSDLLEIYMENANQLVKDAFQIHIVSKRLDRLAKDYQVESARANNEAEAIEALKRQNKALAESIKKMDMEYSELNKEHTEVAAELITAKMDIARIHDENEALRQQSNDLKKALETLPAEVETRVKEEMEILYTKNAALVERNSALEDQLAYMENMIIEIKEKYSESENEREGLRQRLTDLKRLMG